MDQMTAAQPPRDAAMRAYQAFAPAYDDFTGTLDYEPWLVEVLPRLERYGISGRRLLDVGCGTGKSLTPMLDRGWQAAGCDISPAMVEVARHKIGDRARLEVADMRKLPRLGAFDLVWCLNDSINYLIDREELEAALAGMRANLSDKGVLVFDVNALLSYRTFFAERMVVERKGRRMIWSGKAVGNEPPGSIFEATFEVDGPPADGRIEPRIHRQRHFTEPEVLAAFDNTGLECLDVFGQDKGGGLWQPLEELEHVKALYFARRRTSNI